MNGRLAILIPQNDLESVLGLKTNPSEVKRYYSELQYNLSPSSLVPLVTNLQQERIRFFKWGLIPSWSNTSKNTKGLISIETKAILDKPVLQAAFQNKRCLTPCNGFYLWKDSNAGKIPYFIKLKTGAHFYIGGVWESWEEEQENALNTFSIITKKPIGALRYFGQDIPFIIKPTKMEEWLKGELENITELLAEANTILESDFEYYPVGRKIIKSIENDPKFIQKISYLIAEQTNLF